MKKKRFQLFLIIITIVSIFTRFYKLPSYPVSLSIDEVSFGYNAYSILKVGKDEFGKTFPLSFQALGDYKLPVQVYLTSLSIFFFGLNEFSVRFFPALFGALTPLFAVLVLRELKFSKFASIVTGLWLAVLPWHVFFSRVTYESICALFFVILGLLFYLKSVKKLNLWGIAVSFVFFGLSVWTYNSFRVFTPLFIGFLLYKDRQVFRKKFLKSRLIFLSVFTILIFFGSLLMLSLFNKDILGRIGDLRLSNDPWLAQMLHKGNYLNLLHRVFDNDYYLIFINWVGQYLKYFDLKFIFWKGLNLTPPQSLGLGILNIVDLPIIAVGVYLLLKAKNGFNKQLALFLLLTGPLAASFTRGEPNAIRVLTWVFFFSIVFACFWQGLEEKKVLKKEFIFAVYFGFLLINSMYSFDIYTVGFQKYYADVWNYGYKEAMNYVCKNWQSYDRVIVTDIYGVSEPKTKTVPYLYALFYCKYPPNIYQNNKEIYNIGFRRPYWFGDSKLKNTLLIGSNWDFPEGFPESWVKETIYFPSGEVALKIVETSSDKYYQSKY